MKTIKRITVISLIFFVLVWGVVWLISPMLSRALLSDFFADQNLVLDDSTSVRLNLFRSSIKIKDLSWSNQDKKSLELDELEVRYSLLRLVLRELYIDRLTLSGVRANASLVDGKLLALGFDLDRAIGTTDEQEEPASQVDLKDFQFAVRAPEMIVENFDLYVQHEQQYHEFRINKLEVSDASFKNGVLEASLGINALLNTAQLNLETAVSYLPEMFSAELSFEMSNFNPAQYSYLLPKSIQNFESDISAKFDASLEQNDASISWISPDFQIDLKNSIYRDDLLGIEVEQAQFQLSGLSMQNDAVTGLQINTDASLRVDEVDVLSEDSSSRLLSFEKLSLPEAQLVIEGENIDFQATVFSQEGIVVSQNKLKADEPLPALLSLENLNIDNIRLSKEQLDVGKIRIGPVNVQAMLDEDAKMVSLVALVEQGQGVEEQSDTADKSGRPAPVESEQNPDDQLSILVDEIVLEQGVELRLLDKSVAPEFDKTFYIDDLVIADIDSVNIEKAAEFVLSAHDGEYFKLQLKGSAQPFKPRINAELEFSSSELSLHEISPYIKKGAGFEVEAGQLDSDINASIVDSQLDGKVVTSLRGAKFSSGSKSASNELDVIGQSAIPLNVALNMLKDDSGNIRLVVPLDGDINDPNFGIHYIVGLVVKKAVMSQTRKHLINTFVPYGQIVNVAMSAGSYALKVRFEDLPYRPTQIEPDDDQSLFIEQLETLMVDRQGLQIRLCSVAVSSDIGLTDAQTLSPEQQKALTDIASQRAAAFKERMIKAGIDSARLLICSPEIDTAKDSIPRLKLSV